MSFGTHLIDGVTGSGKTELYFKLIEEKKVDIVSFVNGEKKDKEDYSLQGINCGYDLTSIKEIKYKMCTRNYNHGIAILNTGEKIKFNPNPNSSENEEKKK